jgi:tetratricopeptide (TPR) repeat protein
LNPNSGVVLIANFGLRGSTFPNMVAERAIPFTIAVITLLKTELRVECHVGATFDNAYCGVVGGVSRHEYAVLGPSVNLAARLMAHPNNSGFYVDQSVKEKAGSRRFAALPPVKAKGYKDLVQIFEPLPLHDAIRSDLEFRFVGRKAELHTIMEQAKVKTNTRAAHFFLVTGDSGSGKSSLCRQASKQIKMICEESDLTYLSIGIACNEGDVFVPFSITQPLFLEALNFIQNPDAPPEDILESLDGVEISSSLEGNFHQEFSSKTLEYLAGIFEEVHIPDQFKLTIAKLILTRNRADIVECPDNATHCLMLDTLAQYIAEAFLSIIASVDLVLILIDEVVNMDEMSWKIVEKLFCHSQNIFFLGTAKTFEREKVKASANLWSIFLSEDLSMRRFMTVTVEPISLADASNIAQELQDEKLLSCSEASFRTLQLLAQFCDEEMKKQGLSTEDSSNAVVVGVNVANIREMVLQCLDSLQPTLRQYLNLGAILGTSFELMDIVSVFEQHDQVPKEKLRSYASSVHESLEEAVEKGILAFTERESASHVRYNMSDHPYFEKNKIYKFTHDVWRSTILKLTLDEWKKDMHILIAKSMEAFIDLKLGNDLRPLTLLFSHWKESGSAREAANLALKIGRQLENRGLNHESLMVYRQSLDMWKVMDNVNEEPNEMIGGLSTSLLSALKSVDIEYLIKLYVALGRCYSNMLEPKESITCFQTALGFILKSPHSLVLHDPMLIFPVVSGLFYTCRFGHDENLEYEEKLVELFEKETKRYSDSMHLSIALAMKAEMFVRNGMLFDAVNSANILRNLYIADQHPNDLTKVYGSDRAGQCIAQSALWNECIGDSERSLCICRYVIDTILPNVDHQDIYNIFQILYPLVWALKRLDNASEAYDIFMKYVVHNADTRLDSRGSTSDKPLHFPIMALLDLATNSRTERFDEYFAWVIDDKNGTFGIKLNCMMGSVGRTADSITAELCLIMTRYVSDSQEKRAFLVNKGYHLAKNVMGITVKCNQSRGMTVPQILEQHIVDQLGIMYNELVPLK